MSHAVSHHIHKRKRVHQNLEAFPHPNPGIRFLDRLLLIIAIIGPLSTLPQIIKIYLYQSSLGVSRLTFSLFALFDIPWAIYGIIHKEKPIILAYSLWFIANLIIVIGTLIYP